MPHSRKLSLGRCVLSREVATAQGKPDGTEEAAVLHGLTICWGHGAERQGSEGTSPAGDTGVRSAPVRICGPAPQGGAKGPPAQRTSRAPPCSCLPSMFSWSLFRFSYGRSPTSLPHSHGARWDPSNCGSESRGTGRQACLQHIAAGSVREQDGTVGPWLSRWLSPAAAHGRLLHTTAATAFCILSGA